MKAPEPWKLIDKREVEVADPVPERALVKLNVYDYRIMENLDHHYMTRRQKMFERAEHIYVDLSITASGLMVLMKEH